MCRYSAHVRLGLGSRGVWGKCAVALVMVALVLTGCSGGDKSDQPNGTAPNATAPAQTKSKGVDGPMFTECGVISEKYPQMKFASIGPTIRYPHSTREKVKIVGLVGTAKNSVGCVWLRGGSIVGPHFSFNWYRGSPIGRERATEERTRPSVEDIEIAGYKGFIATNGYPGTVTTLCEIGMDFGNDFIEWSINFEPGTGAPDSCDVAKQLTETSIKAAKK